MKKIKLNTVKSKMVAGVAAVTLFSGVGFVAANTDAGGALQGWYNKALGKATVELETEVVKHGAEKLVEFKDHAKEEKNNGINSINTTKADELSTKKETINAAKQSHIDSVTARETAIKDYMDDQFNKLSAANINTFNALGSLAYFAADLDLTYQVNKVGKSAFSSLQDELNAEKEAAVTALDTRIVEAKGNLLAQLETEKNGTTEEIKAAIDAKIAQLKLDITAKKDGLVTTWTTKLTDEANKIEAAAKAELDAQIMISINKN